MDIKTAIKVLKEVSDYIEEDWDPYEHQKDIDEAVEAIKIAISSLKNNKAAGTMVLNGKNYIISKVD